MGISKGIFSVGGGWCSFLFEGRDVWRYILGWWGVEVGGHLFWADSFGWGMFWVSGCEWW